MLDVPDILLSVASAANLVVVWFVYERDRHNPVNQLFSLFVFFIAVWGLIILLFRSVDNAAAALVLIKLSYVSALLLAFCFYRFALIFPNPGTDECRSSVRDLRGRHRRLNRVVDTGLARNRNFVRAVGQGGGA